MYQCRVARTGAGWTEPADGSGAELRCTSATAPGAQALVEHAERGRAGQWRMGELGGDGIRRRVAKIVGFEIPVASAEMRTLLGAGERPTDLTAAIERLRVEHPELVAAIAERNGLPLGP